LKSLLRNFENQEFLDSVVRRFLDKLQGLRKYAEMTQVQDSNGRNVLSWASGHRPADSKPESWATASVFSYMHAYRRILGILARRDALHHLPSPILPKDAKPIQTLTQRGDTWLPLPTSTSVAEDLITLFVNPIQKEGSFSSSEPDDQPIGEWQARSAILFGPPGASKTTLAQAVGAALGWKYVELHSSHFVAEGIQAVQLTADRIFAFLMELDHAVVLFDEPDELVRERDGASDAFGRFLTTSMLPRLAQLWKQRKIIYFVATNHIKYFDAAIIRSERFDVSLCVPPPSFGAKRRELERQLKRSLGREDVGIVAAQDDIEKALIIAKGAWAEADQTDQRKLLQVELPKEALLAKLLLLRWDQLDELVLRLLTSSSSRDVVQVDSKWLSRALDLIDDPRLRKLHTYGDYFNDLEQVRRDYRMKPLYSVRNPATDAEYPDSVFTTITGRWLKCPSGARPANVGQYDVFLTDTPGEVELRSSAPSSAIVDGVHR
jgi:hypothetical protein